MNAHEVFVDRVRCALVHPRHNTRRAFAAIEAGDLAQAKQYLKDVAAQIAHAEALAEAEDQRTMCECPVCGDSHYQRAGRGSVPDKDTPQRAECTCNFDTSWDHRPGCPSQETPA